MIVFCVMLFCIVVGLLIKMRVLWRDAEMRKWEYEKQCRHEICKEMVREYKLRQLYGGR